jgi:hypothetical protein
LERRWLRSRIERQVLEDDVEAAIDDLNHFVDVARRLREELGGPTCVECGARSSNRARGWCAYIGDVRDQEPLEVFVFCPECAEREFGPS